MALSLGGSKCWKGGAIGPENPMKFICGNINGNSIGNSVALFKRENFWQWSDLVSYRKGALEEIFHPQKLIQLSFYPQCLSS